MRDKMRVILIGVISAIIPFTSYATESALQNSVCLMHDADRGILWEREG
jgi:hypothetical protein